MRAASAGGLLAVRTEGGLLSPDTIARLVRPKPDLEGVSADAYHLGTERFGEVITRSWNRMLGEWARFQESAARLSSTDAGTGVTRDRLLYPLFQELGYGRLVPARGIEVDGKTYSVSHLWNRTPIHLVGRGVDLDRRASGVAGAAQASPHGLVQELLNRSQDHLWGFVCNGLRLRILRDNRSLTRQAYVELDLEAIFEGQLYADFVALWMLCHQSRVEAELPEQCWLERWSTLGREQGARALESLRTGVTQAIESLGRGFLAHRANRELREKLQKGRLSTQDYYRQLLRLVYRLLFLFVAEDRDVLHPRDSLPEAREAYRRYYSTHRLRELAESIRGSAHSDLYVGLRTMMDLLGTLGAPELALPALGSFLWSSEFTPDLRKAEIANADLLAAVRALAFTTRGKDLWRVDYRNLGSEELGSVYESLLELHPDVNADGAVFSLKVAAGHERKTTGSYYTPHSLVQCLLDSALDPVLEEAAKSPDAEKAILELRVCDPATGSGHFLIAAAHRIARRLASVRTGDEEPSPEATRTALRDVIGRCIYGVDVNPMAVELCKVSLWMEALDPGKPLSFLDAHIQCGNSLLGSTPELMANGIPNEAIGELTGDDKATVRAHRKRNREERQGQLGLKDETGGLWGEVLPEVKALASEGVDDSTLEGVRALEQQYHRQVESEAYRHARLAADAWCAAFVWPRSKGQQLPGLTHGLWRQVVETPRNVPAAVVAEVERIAGSYRFFHWHLAFPEVFGGEGGGFDVVLGNPPWEQTEFREKEWFADKRMDVATAAGAKRKRLIEGLETEDAPVFEAYKQALRIGEGGNQLGRESGRYPLCGRGKTNTYSLFAEAMRTLLAPRGRMGAVIPSAIATDDTTKWFFADLTQAGALLSLFDFQSGPGLFSEIGHARFKFSLVTIGGTAIRDSRGAEFAFFLRDVALILDPKRRFRLAAGDIALMNPNTRTCPIFRTRRDAEITRAIYQRVRVLIKEGPPEENPWGLSFRQGLFNMTSDSGLFQGREELEAKGYRMEGNRLRKGKETYLPLYEAKMIHHFDHRWATYDGEDTRDVSPEEKGEPEFAVMPRYWVAKAEVDARLEGRWDRGWLLGWRDICRSTDERTVIASVVPRVAVGHTMPLFLLTADVTAKACATLLANLNTLVFDYVARQKIGGTHLTYLCLKQLPVLAPSAYEAPCPWSRGGTLMDWIVSRVLELVYTARDVEPFARECGYDGSPFVWDKERRFRLRCELDSAFFYLYGIGQEDMNYILDTFPIVRQHDEHTFGEFRTKRAIREGAAKLGVSGA